MKPLDLRKFCKRPKFFYLVDSTHHSTKYLRSIVFRLTRDQRAVQNEHFDSVRKFKKCHFQEKKERKSNISETVRVTEILQYYNIYSIQ